MDSSAYGQIFDGIGALIKGLFAAVLILVVLCGFSSYGFYQFGKRAGAKEEQHRVLAEACEARGGTLDANDVCVHMTIVP